MALPLPPLVELAVSAGGAIYVAASVLATLTGATGPAAVGRLGREGVWFDGLRTSKTRTVLMSVFADSTKKEVGDLILLNYLNHLLLILLLTKIMMSDVGLLST